MDARDFPSAPLGNLEVKPHFLASAVIPGCYPMGGQRSKYGNTVDELSAAQIATLVTRFSAIPGHAKSAHLYVVSSMLEWLFKQRVLLLQRPPSSRGLPESHLRWSLPHENWDNPTPSTTALRGSPEPEADDPCQI